MNAATTRNISTALIIGGGIAGMSCALRFAEQGIAVTLLETRKKLGGRATSFQDVRSGRWLDNCQHVVLGCCTNYMDLLARLGAADKIKWYREQYWIEEGGRTSIVKRGGLPAPAHFSLSMLGASFLTTGEKLQIARACSKIMRVDRRTCDAQTFGTFLHSCGQSERALRRFWAPVVVSACNLDVDRVSASSALHVFQEGFLASATSADIGIPAVPLLDLYEQAERLITATGGSVRYGAGAELIDERGATTTDGERFEADRVVCAVPVERVNRIITADIRARDSRFANLDKFTHSPILGVHMTFDRPVMEHLPHAVLVDRPTQWLFRKDAEGKSIHAVISAADVGGGAGGVSGEGGGWISLTEEQIGDRVLADIRACLPQAQGPNPPALLSVRAVKEKLATFAPVPGLDAFRPKAASIAGESSIILAGDYTDTGWPATMEGATRSGYAAAAAALGCDPDRMLIPSLPVAPLARLLGLK